ncbi:hypothetical protein [Pseudomonas sp. NPDC089734]|uniref:hypothetical protein n=1 Tax=Pseudomonas sp. NPDC089734 TaxID=3364469 RepID=UPI0038152BDE
MSSPDLGWAEYPFFVLLKPDFKIHNFYTGCDDRFWVCLGGLLIFVEMTFQKFE